jgi:hypothetical protein
VQLSQIHGPDGEGFLEIEGAGQLDRLAVAKAIQNAYAPVAEERAEVPVEATGVHGPPLLHVASVGPFRALSAINPGLIVTVYGPGVEGKMGAVPIP